MRKLLLDMTRICLALVAASFAAVSLLPSNARADQPSPERDVSDATPAKHAEDRYGSIKTLSFGSPMPLDGGIGAESNCTMLGSRCTAAPRMPGAVTFTTGYMWNHLGFDLLVGAGVDGSDRAYVDYAAAKHTYTVGRLNGLAAVRLRAQLQTSFFRGAAAVGPGVVYHVIAKGKDLSSMPDEVRTQGSLALTADVSGQLRLGTSTSLTLGTMLWIEKTAPSVTTDHGDLRVATGAQATVMPYVGLQFGP